MTEELIREIHEAFRDVTRQGGVSWRETNVLDNYGSDEERARARALETDSTWMDVVKDPPWPHAWGSFSYLDAIGFRYYLAAAMVRALQGHLGEDDDMLNLHFHLTLPAVGDKLRDYTLEQWSLLDANQGRCVGRFLIKMGGDRALKSYWKRFLKERNPD
jgi:hypothetical protein